ncbi:flagellar motor switch protein FliN [Cohaesibacter haloalkalitolerans]|uniref:flagellar motor switch protein FliN n=1 Tax=Cohaesibacter haloalkalitolerans TaxID=1162980 RepID=UPI000E651434|nr:flagellar motor switch protein FliN [Cohaesibacter haloalkalitolerans]
MSDNDKNEGLTLQEQNARAIAEADFSEDSNQKNAADLEAVFDVPVQVSAILGRAKMPVSELLDLDVGNVLELDRKVGEAVDIYVNSRLVARGEVVLVEEKLGVTMTEIIKSEK